VLKIITKKSLSVLALLAVGGCNFQSTFNFLDHPFEKDGGTAYDAPIKMPNSVVVCRSKQCGAAKLSMSREYIYNSLLHLFDNNNHKTALICAANPGSHTCTETFITMPITVGITPAYAYIDAVKITDVSVGSGTTKLGLVLNYNVTYNGQTPSCVPAKSLMYVKNVNNIILEDAGYNCKMTTIGQTTIKTLFAIDYIDLDYGFIGGYYSIGFSGPAYGGGSGYMMIRLPKDAYPLAPELRQPESAGRSVSSLLNGTAAAPAVTEEKVEMNTNVQIFPLNKK
jgi:lipoprotein